MRDCMSSARHMVEPLLHPIPNWGGLQCSPEACSLSPQFPVLQTPNRASLQGPFLQSPPKVRSSALWVMHQLDFLHGDKNP